MSWYKPTMEEIAEMIRRHDERQRIARELYDLEMAARREAVKRATERENHHIEPKPKHFTDRERRSRIDWAALTGDDELAKRQIAWERRATALKMREAKFKLADVGAHFGVTRERARQMILRAERERNRPDARSPIENRLAEPDRTNFAGNKRKMVMAVLDVCAHPPSRDWLLVGS